MIRITKSEIRTALLTASNDETRPHLCGVLFSRENGLLRTISTDGHRMTVIERTDAGADCAVFIPRWMLEAAPSVFEYESGCSRERFDVSEGPRIEAVIELTEIQKAHKRAMEHGQIAAPAATRQARYVRVSHDGENIVTSVKIPTGTGFWLLDRKEDTFWTYPSDGPVRREFPGQYRTYAPAIYASGLETKPFPCWQQVIPGSQDFTATIDRRLFRKAVSRTTNACIELTTGGKVVVYAVDEAFSLVEPMNVGTHVLPDRAVEGSCARVGFLSRYVEEAASAMKVVKVRNKEVGTFEFGMSGSLDPATFVSGGVKVVCMPMRIA